MLSNKRIKRYALEIVEAEKEIQLGKNVQSNQSKIIKIMSKLSIEDSLRLDIYISENNLLTE